jgi:2,3-bisphosphoglycerate-dependent phosphoglycerate mutase
LANIHGFVRLIRTFTHIVLGFLIYDCESLYLSAKLTAFYSWATMRIGGCEMIRLLIMRHGESEADIEPRRLEGNADFPLTARGAYQAERLALRIGAEYQLDLLVTSPLRRAYATAEAISRTTGQSIQVDERLREKSNGILAGMVLAELEKTHPLPPGGRKIHEAPPGGESKLQQYARVAEFWYSLYYGEDDRTIAVVTHGGTIQCLYRLALGIPLTASIAFRCGDTSLHEWHISPGGQVIIQRANCTKHLD